MREYFENNGHLNDKGVSLYVDALRSARVNELPGELTGHVEKCTECKKSVIQLHALMKETPLEADDVPPFFKKRTKRVKKPEFSAYRIAAATAFFVFAGILVFYFSQSPHVPEFDPDALADYFEPLPLYDSMVEQDFRSYGLEIISPKVADEISDAVLFQWDIQYTDPLIVTIFNNRGDLIHEKKVTDNEYRYDDLPGPGLYYWRLETEERLLYVGKFIVPVDYE